MFGMSTTAKMSVIVNFTKLVHILEVEIQNYIAMIVILVSYS